MSKKNVSLPPLDVAQRYSTREACAYLRTSNATLYNLIAAGELRVIREGKRTYVPGTEIARRSTLAQ
jgi:excisionase family DNA binding protein